jgi:carbonic anhydrase/acetyltransferase-like protein (isoleucine patch superfamily)
MPIQRLGDLTPRIADSAWVHPTATIIGDVELGAHSSVWPGAVLRGDFAPIRIGAGTIVEDGVVIHCWSTGTFIGDECVFGHMAFAEGAVVEDGCLVAVKAALLPGSILRERSVAAAGAVLVGGLEVPTGMRAQGVPATLVPARDITAELAAGRSRYVELARRYEQELEDV